MDEIQTMPLYRLKHLLPERHPWCQHHLCHMQSVGQTTAQWDPSHPVYYPNSLQGAEIIWHSQFRVEQPQQCNKFRRDLHYQLTTHGLLTGCSTQNWGTNQMSRQNPLLAPGNGCTKTGSTEKTRPSKHSLILNRRLSFFLPLPVEIFESAFHFLLTII